MAVQLRNATKVAGTERSVAAIQSMFDNMVAGWASDWLKLMARGLDQPVSCGRPCQKDMTTMACDGSKDRASDIALSPSRRRVVNADAIRRGRRAA